MPGVGQNIYIDNVLLVATNAARYYPPQPWLELGNGSSYEHGTVELTSYSLVQPRVLSVQATNGVNVNISWESESNVVYRVEYSPSLRTNSWSALGSTILGNGTKTNIVDNVQTDAPRFYRVVELP